MASENAVVMTLYCMGLDRKNYS